MGLGALTDGLAPTPPMGWNSWNRFGPFVSDQLVRETADALIVSGMRDVGYRYVVVDDAWEGSLRSDDGNLEPNLWRFPNMHGLAPLPVMGLGGQRRTRLADVGRQRRSLGERVGQPRTTGGPRAVRGAVQLERPGHARGRERWHDGRGVPRVLLDVGEPRGAAD